MSFVSFKIWFVTQKPKSKVFQYALKDLNDSNIQKKSLTKIH